MHTLAHNIASSNQDPNILLVQEPWWNSNITTSFQGWQAVLPTPTIKENECLRVVAYYRLQAGIEMTLRTDIGTDLDFMILDVKREGLRHLPTCIINIYNQVELGEAQELRYMTNGLANVNIHPGTPTIITGDWNLHHNSWNSTVDVESTPARTQEVVDWLKGQGFSMCSERDVHTRSSSGTHRDSVIDLTFANETVTRQGIIRNHAVNPELAILSDHHALTFTLGNPREMVHNITEAKYNWKEADEEKFIEALEQELHADEEIFDTTIQQVLNKNRTQTSPEELDNAVRLINVCMECAAEKAVPIR